MSAYDIIGDIHGHATTLVALLESLGYRKTTTTHSANTYTHPNRQAIFLGDFIDRGPQQREVIERVKPMIESGSALSVMGNHEFNAIAFHTPDDTGDYLRKHSEKNIQQHQAFLDAYPDAIEREQIINWFKTLPMWLDLPGLRVVHACWDTRAINKLQENYASLPHASDALVHAASQAKAWEYRDVEILLKGKELPLPHGYDFKDKDGHTRHDIRIKWWSDASTYREAFMGPEDVVTHIPEDPIEGDHLIEYKHDEKPVFLGHYWLVGEPKPLAPNVACLDYSVAKKEQLVAYRWDGEQVLDKGKFVAVTQS